MEKETKIKIIKECKVLLKHLIDNIDENVKNLIKNDFLNREASVSIGCTDNYSFFVSNLRDLGFSIFTDPITSLIGYIRIVECSVDDSDFDEYLSSYIKKEKLEEGMDILDKKLSDIVNNSDKFDFSVTDQIQSTIDDALYLIADKDTPKSREMSLVKTKLEEAQLWLSQVK